MAIDLYAKSQQLLERLANSIHDRDPKNINPFTFNVAEIHAAEEWLREFEREVRKECIGLLTLSQQPLGINNEKINNGETIP